MTCGVALLSPDTAKKTKILTSYFFKSWDFIWTQITVVSSTMSKSIISLVYMWANRQYHKQTTLKCGVYLLQLFSSPHFCPCPWIGIMGFLYSVCLFGSLFVEHCWFWGQEGSSKDWFLVRTQTSPLSPLVQRSLFLCISVLFSSGIWTFLTPSKSTVCCRLYTIAPRAPHLYCILFLCFLLKNYLLCPNPICVLNPIVYFPLSLSRFSGCIFSILFHVLFFFVSPNPIYFLTYFIKSNA